MAGLNQYVGWGITTFLLSLLNKGSNSADEESKADTLNMSSSQTKIGSPIPVVLGRCLVKSPIVSYFGDFRADIYTEEYAAHANFSAWPLVFTFIAQYIGQLITGHQVGAADVTADLNDGTVHGGEGGSVSTGVKGVSKGAKVKDDFVGPLLNTLFMWLLNWLINGRNLKTTVQKGFRYYLGYQFLVAWSGPNMRIRRIYMEQKKAWDGDVSRSAQAGNPLDIEINDENLFGGCDENGGFSGHFHVQLGGGTQPDSWMIGQMSKDSVQTELRGLTPAYGPFVSIVVPTAYIGKQSTLPETWIELQCCPDGLGLGQVGEDANPAEVVYEIITNNDWGLAEPATNINKDALVKMGETLKAEGVGISVELTSTTKAQSLIDKICEHVNAVRFSDPATGQLTFRLIRDDYDLAACLRLTVSNCSSVKFTRLDWSQTVSKVSVSYTDADNQYEDSTVPEADPANIEINSGIQTVKSYDYTYFTTAVNAKWSAQRELNSQAYPLAAVDVEGNRELAMLRIGDVVVLNWEPYGVKNMILRLTNVDLGEYKDGKVTISAVEDVFGLAKTDFDFSGSTEWKPEDKYPAGVQDFRYLELPYEIVNCNDTYVAAMAAKPDEKTQSWTVWRQVSGKPFASTNSMSKWSAAGRLVYDVAEFGDAEDTVGFELADLGGIDALESGIVDIAVARKGSRLLVVDDEIMAYSTLTQLPNGHWYVKGVLRGACDTVPGKHYAQEDVFFLRSGNYANVTTGGPVAAAGAAVTEQYNITTATVNHTEDFDVTKVKELTTRRRAECPSVPGCIRMSAHLQRDVLHTDKMAGDLSIDFVPRNNRQSFGAVSQDDTVEYWTKQAFAAADGTDYVLRLIVGSETKDYIFAVAPAVVTWEQRCSDFKDISSETRAELYARKGGLLSYQPQIRTFQWTIPVLVDCASSEAEARDRLDAWGIADRIVMPDGVMATQKQVLYADLPVIALGTPAGAGTSGAIYGYDGSRMIPDGRILRITGKGTYDLYTIQAGFAFNSYYVPAASGGQVQSYEWDGAEVKERNDS